MKYKLHIDNVGNILTMLYGLSKEEFEKWLMEKIEEEKLGNVIGKWWEKI